MSIIKHVTLQKIVAHDFRYDPRNFEQQQNIKRRFSEKLNTYYAGCLKKGKGYPIRGQ